MDGWKATVWFAGISLPQLSHENDGASPQCSWQKRAVSFAICSFEGVKELGPSFALINLTGPMAA